MIEYLVPVASKYAALNWLEENRPIRRRVDGKVVMPNDFPLGSRILAINERFTPYALARTRQGPNAGKWHALEVRNGQVRPAAKHLGRPVGRRDNVADNLTVERLIRELKNGEPGQP